MQQPGGPLSDHGADGSVEGTAMLGQGTVRFNIVHHALLDYMDNATETEIRVRRLTTRPAVQAITACVLIDTLYASAYRT